MRPNPCHEYRIARNLQRCCWYTIFGAFALAAVYFWIARFVQNRGGPVDISVIFVGCALFALLAAAMVVPLRWKVRVDQRGISRRLLFGWDLWPWAALASGRISKIHPFTLHDPERASWRRRLRLEYMAPGDIQEVISMVNTHYKLPPPPSISTTLAIKYGFRRWVTFDSNGIHLIVRDMPHDYRWSDLRDVHFTRMDPLRRDFTSLVITLPDRELELKFVTHQGGRSPTWRGATAEELNEVLFRFVPTDRIHISIAGQRLEKREHIERKLKEKKKRAREYVMMMVFWFPLVLGLLVWKAIDDGILGAIVMGAMFVVFPGSVMFVLYRSDCKETAKLIDSLNDVAVTSASNPLLNIATDQGSESERLHFR